MKSKCVSLVLFGLVSFGWISSVQAQELQPKGKSQFMVGLEYYLNLGITDAKTSSPSERTALEINNRVKQFEQDYNTTAEGSTLATHFSADAVMLGADGYKTKGINAIEQRFAEYFQFSTCKVAIEVDEILELPDGYVLTFTHYLDHVTSKENGSTAQFKGYGSTLWRKENNIWKIVHYKWGRTTQLSI
jgi:ketosteroid isomerase-like protein